MTAALLTSVVTADTDPAHCLSDCKQPIAACLRLVPKNRSCAGEKTTRRIRRQANADQRKSCRGKLRRCRRHNHPDGAGTCLPACGTFLTAWGSGPVGVGGLAIDGTGDVFVADGGTNRIRRFDAQGTPRAVWGGMGAAAGKLTAVAGLAVDPRGRVLVVDAGNHRVQAFDTNGALLASWGSAGSGPGQFSDPIGASPSTPTGTSSCPRE